tara:strand:- start:301 stop:705 length:405 start_codon:yes stop_codon:yes gene_type:complete
MGLRVEITYPPKYYKEQIAKAKKAGDMKKVKKLEKELAVREREINKQESMDRNAKANAGDLLAGSAMGGANAPKPKAKPKMPMPKKKPEMMYGGMANNKKHMYSAGGSVTANLGLAALKKQRPDVVAKMMKGKE